MTATWIKAIAAIGFAQAFIMVGIYFAGGILMQKSLAGVYAALSPGWRFFLALAIVFSTSNAIMAHAYSHYPPTVAAPVTIFFMVICQIAFSVLAFDLKPSLWIVPATLCVTASCVWVSLLLLPKG